jgi:hypothetical protein
MTVPRQDLGSKGLRETIKTVLGITMAIEADNNAQHLHR